jgi:putative phosphoesterase
MKIGILSDTHNRPQAMRSAIALLQHEGAKHLLHCGDVGDRDMLDHLAGLHAGFVWGNNDFDRADLKHYAAELGVTCYGEFGEVVLGGRSIAIAHGDDARVLKRLLDEQKYDYLLLGHTHVPLDKRYGSMRVINPGALHRATKKTCALLDTESDFVRFLTVDS